MWTTTPIQLYLDELDFEVKFSLLSLLIFLSDLKSDFFWPVIQIRNCHQN